VIDFLSIPAVRFQQESLSALNRPAVRFLQELVSAFSRNPCPLWSGIGVRFAQEQVSALHKIMQNEGSKNWCGETYSNDLILEEVHFIGKIRTKCLTTK
jgi:hypothetical protein